MRVRLMTRWAGWMQNDVVSVSDARAVAMQEAGIGRIIDAIKPKVEEAPEEEAPVQAAPKPRGPGRK